MTPVREANLSLAAVREAQILLSKHLPRTRLVRAPALSSLTGANVFLKLESELPTGSFKPRGALYALEANLRRRSISGVVASSTGNHGAAVAYAAQRLEIPAYVFLPQNPNPVKRAKITALGATIFETGHDISDAWHAASEFSQAHGFYFLNDATDPDLPAGPAAIGLEILEELPDADAIYVPMGDTALIRGIAAVAKQLSSKVRVIGVQAKEAPSYYLSWLEGKAIPTESCNTIADGLATRTPDATNVEAIKRLVDDVRLVTEQELLSAVRCLLFEEHVVAEPSGAAGTAALLQESGSGTGNIVLIVSGANIAPDVLRLAI